MADTHKGPSWDQLNRTLGQDRTTVQFEGVGGNAALEVDVTQLDSLSHGRFLVYGLDANGKDVVLLGHAASEDQPGTYKQL